MQIQNAQTRLFEQLCEKHGRPQVIQELKQLLHLEKSVLYKRMSGEKELTFNEMLKIANHFHISLDRLRSSERTVVFEFPGEKPTEMHSPIAFLNTIASDMKAMLMLPQLRIRYIAPEIPLFHYFQFPELTLFKLYQWNRIAWRNEWLNAQKFKPDPNLFGGQVALDLAADIHQYYRRIHTAEIWATSVFDNTLAQIVFTAKIGKFESTKMPKILIGQMAEVAKRMEKFAEKGEKAPQTKGNPAGKLEAYHNQTAYTNNLILIENGARHHTVYSTFDNPNFLKTKDSDLCDYATRAFDRLVSVSENIALASEPNRQVLFEELSFRLQRAESQT